MSDTESFSATVGMDYDDEPEEMETELTEDELVTIAEGKKEEGNTLYKLQKYKEATTYYSQAISLCPNCAAYYGNRSAAYLMVSDYRNALDDSRMATKLDPTFIKGYIREGKCHIAMGNPVAALNVYNKALCIDPCNRPVKQDVKIAEHLQKLEDSLEKDLEKDGDTRRALYYINKCLEQSPTCVRYKVKKAEILTLLGKLTDSQDLILGVLQADSMNADALYVRGVVLYYLDNIDKAFQHFQQVLRLSPDHAKSRDFYKRAKLLVKKKAEGNAAFKDGRLQEAYKIYTEALAIDERNKSTNSKLYFNRATVASKIDKTQEAIADCTSAIKLDGGYTKAYLRRAKCYMDSEQYEEAVRDYEAVCRADKTKENVMLLKEAKLELKKSKRKDYYKILGVIKSANEDEIKKAYKKRALIHHPDRHAHDDKEVQNEEEKKFKEVGEAYGVLSDAKKKMRYDQGQDLEEIEGAGFDHIDPDVIFQSFFGGGGGGMPGGFSFASSFPQGSNQSFSFHFA